jgi:predicted hydrocarbon binding protein
MSAAIATSAGRSVAFFEHDYFRHDLLKGTLHNRGGTKMCYLPCELIQSLKDVLEEETGEAWSQILFRVGRIWGRRVARRFHAELQQFYQRPLDEMPMPEFVAILEGYFRYHGWGLLRLDFAHGESGVIQATLENGAFVELIGMSSKPVDSIVTGLLSEFFCQISDRTDVDCLETQCVACGAPVCRFVITTEARLSAVRRMAESGSTHDAILEQLVGKLACADLSQQDTQELGSRRRTR